MAITSFCMSGCCCMHWRLFSSFTELSICCIRPYLFSCLEDLCFCSCLEPLLPFFELTSAEQRVYLPQLRGLSASSFLLFVFLVPQVLVFSDLSSFLSSGRAILCSCWAWIDKFPKCIISYGILGKEIVSGDILDMSLFLFGIEISIEWFFIDFFFHLLKVGLFGCDFHIS